MIFDGYGKEHIGLKVEVNLSSPVYNHGVIDLIFKLSGKKLLW